MSEPSLPCIPSLVSHQLLLNPLTKVSNNHHEHIPTQDILATYVVTIAEDPPFDSVTSVSHLSSSISHWISLSYLHKIPLIISKSTDCSLFIPNILKAPTECF